MKCPYQNPALPVEERLDDLMKRLSPEEKIGQLCKPRVFSEFKKTADGAVLKEEYREFSRKNPPGCVYGILRSDPWTKRNFQNGAFGEVRERIVRLFDEDAASHAVPVPLAKAEEAPHGLSALEATVFPCGLAVGASFDRELAEEIGRAIGREALACGINTVYAPVLDIASDPRWSRVEECYGEDPALVAELGESCFRGIQETGVLALLKHYIGGGASENGLNQQPAHIGTAELYNGPLRPFRRCIDAGAKALMSTMHGKPLSADGTFARRARLQRICHGGRRGGGASLSSAPCEFAPGSGGACAQSRLRYGIGTSFACRVRKDAARRSARRSHRRNRP